MRQVSRPLPRCNPHLPPPRDGGWRGGGSAGGAGRGLRGRGWAGSLGALQRIAILSDVHANLPALEAVLAEVAREEDVGGIVWLGDVVGYGAQPRECVALARARGGPWVMGNHDQYTAELAREERDRWAGERSDNPVWAGVLHAVRELGGDDVAWLAGLPLVVRIEGAVAAHAALHDPGQWPYLLDSGRAARTWAAMRVLGQSVGFFGHTHRQRWFADPAAKGRPEERGGGCLWVPPDAVCAVVVGSVGQPRDGDGRASWALWDPLERVVEFRRTKYPALAAARAIVAAGLPLHSALRLLDERQALELLAGR